MADQEQQLREKIASQKAALAELPSLKSIVDRTGITSLETKARAQQIKELSDNEEQLELLLESRRMEAIISLQDELHPPENPEDCPICLETIKHDVNVITRVRFYCCGSWICHKCGNESNANFEREGFDKMFSGKCPLCREKFYTQQEAGPLLLKHSNKGKAWAQFLIGTTCMDTTFAKQYGLSGLSSEECRKLIEQAADQGDPDALFFMWKHGDEEKKNMQYLRKAADLGLPEAQHDLACCFYNMSDEKEKLLHYVTLAASQGYSKACGGLGCMFLHAHCGLTHSYSLAKHYAGKSVDCDSSFYNLSVSSYDPEVERYEGIVDIPGHSPIPTFLFWGRRALEGGHNNMPEEMEDYLTKLIPKVEKQAKSRCANCRKEAGCSSFKRCVRCLGAWYCGKACQVQHWKAGHKIDCVKR